MMVLDCLRFLGIARDQDLFSVFLQCLFGKNGTVPFGDRSYCEKSVLSALKQKEKGHLYEGTERNRCVQTGSQCSLSFGSVLLLLVRRRDISPSLSSVRERVASQPTVPCSAAALRAYYDCTFIPSFFRTFFRLQQRIETRQAPIMNSNASASSLLPPISLSPPASSYSCCRSCQHSCNYNSGGRFFSLR